MNKKYTGSTIIEDIKKEMVEASVFIAGREFEKSEKVRKGEDIRGIGSKAANKICYGEHSFKITTPAGVVSTIKLDPAVISFLWRQVETTTEPRLKAIAEDVHVVMSCLCYGKVEKI